MAPGGQARCDALGSARASERRACAVLNQYRCTQWRQRRVPSDKPRLRKRIVQFASDDGRYDYPKLGLVCDAASHFILAARASQGPGPDFGEFEPLLREIQARANLAAIAAEASLDSEASHQLARDELGIQSLILALQGRQPAR